MSVYDQCFLINMISMAQYCEVGCMILHAFLEALDK